MYRSLILALSVLFATVTPARATVLPPTSEPQVLWQAERYWSAPSGERMAAKAIFDPACLQPGNHFYTPGECALREFEVQVFNAGQYNGRYTEYDAVGFDFTAADIVNLAPGYDLTRIVWTLVPSANLYGLPGLEAPGSYAADPMSVDLGGSVFSGPIVDLDESFISTQIQYTPYDPGTTSPVPAPAGLGLALGLMTAAGFAAHRQTRKNRRA